MVYQFRYATLCGLWFIDWKYKEIFVLLSKRLKLKFVVVSEIIWIKGKQSSVGSFTISDICLQSSSSIKPLLLCILFQLLSFSGSSSFFLFKCCFCAKKTASAKFVVGCALFLFSIAYKATLPLARPLPELAESAPQGLCARTATWLSSFRVFLFAQ